MPRRRAGAGWTPAARSPTRRRRALTPIPNPEPEMEMDITLLQERGGDRGQMSRFHVLSPAAIALAPAAAAPATPIMPVSSSNGLFRETELSNEEELQHSVVPNPQEAVPQLAPLPARHTIVPRRVDEKGKEPKEALKQICGICLSEEHRATLQGLLNCCSHYFCFTCILEWSKAESRCPVCKRRFNTITVADEGSGLRNTAIRVEKRDQVYQPGEEEVNPYENAISLIETPTGRRATLDRRRALNRRFLLFRSRTATTAWQNGLQHDRTTPGTEQNQRSTSTSTDVSPSCSRADLLQSQQSNSHFVQSTSNLTHCTDQGERNFREVTNAKDQLIPIVKKSIKHICARSPLDQSSFMNVARRATNTILALSGIEHNRDRVVATPFPFPSHCCHACDGSEPAFLMRTICSACFNSFVGDIVSHIANM